MNALQDREIARQQNDVNGSNPQVKAEMKGFAGSLIFGQHSANYDSRVEILFD